MNSRLFVYGTLAPGRPNEHVLAPVQGSWQPATMRGRLIADGWGAAAGYPGIVLDPDGEAVAGFVFESDDLQQHWARLDEFEGAGYTRVVARAEYDNGQCVDCYVYALAGQPPD